jgi:DNA repair protein RecO (recombination protein O)
VRWDDKGIILSSRRLGESSGLIHLLTEHHGMVAGVDKGAFSKRSRGIYQPGNFVAAHWQARLAEHLGMLSSELTSATTAHLLDDRRRLAALTSATLMVEKVLAERESHPEVYGAMEALVHALCGEEEWLADYVRFEYTLLCSSGFGLDLESCAATGQAHDLVYVSPKSGRAVSRQAGAPYHEKLLALPPFLVSSSCGPRSGSAGSHAIDPVLALCAPQDDITMAHVLDGLRLCGYFFEARVFAPRGIPTPAVRARFIQLLWQQPQAQEAV